MSETFEQFFETKTWLDFDQLFQALTGYTPLRWQRRLFRSLVVPNTIPGRVTLPTGLGKTSVIPIWLIALTYSASTNNGVPLLPRRLIYIVNRRTVVDQATEIVTQMRQRLLTPSDARWMGHSAPLQWLAHALRRLARANDGDVPLGVSTLRGELADNEEWKANPARPAIIIGTIDMVGSKLLFSGYGDGRYNRAQHAGLTGQDALILHDEAHLTPGFSSLLWAIAQEQQRERTHAPELCRSLRPVQVMELSATTRADSSNTAVMRPVFALDHKDTADSVVRQRLTSQKHLCFLSLPPENDLAKAITKAAIQHRNNRCRVLIYVRAPETADRIAGLLRGQLGRKGQDRVALLTGTIRGYERDLLAESEVFETFKADPNRPAQLEETVYLVSTSAGEVGVDLDADHLVCDLTTLDSMIQRFGRVNRLGVDLDGRRRTARITVVVTPRDDKDPLKEQLQKTIAVLRRLPRSGGNYDASPQALAGLLDTQDAQAAFAPSPPLRPATDILFDHWSLTSITRGMPGRPAVAK